MNELVLDASALIALINVEPGADVVANAIAQNRCWVSSVNIAEVVGRLAGRGVPMETGSNLLSRFGFQTVDFDFSAACRCGSLQPLTKALGLSLGDRACIALALLRGCPALTADRPWAKLDVGVEIRLIR